VPFEVSADAAPAFDEYFFESGSFRAKVGAK